MRELIRKIKFRFLFIPEVNYTDKPNDTVRFVVQIRDKHGDPHAIIVNPRDCIEDEYHLVCPLYKNIETVEITDNWGRYKHTTIYKNATSLYLEK
jgi:hypothetical protein